MALRALLTAIMLLPSVPQICRAQQVQEGPAPVNPDLARFIPPNATLMTQLRVDFDKRFGIETLLAYASGDRHSITTGVRVLKYDSRLGWAIVFEEADDVTNGAGPSDSIRIDKVKATSGREGVVVVLQNSGAGTATTWHILAAVGNRISRVNPDRARAKALQQRGYQDWGYNGVTVKGQFVLETQPGFSRDTARCCPDRPTIEMTFRFTGTSVVLDKVAELPFIPANR